mgnify:CR=1 FL=1
MKRPQTFRRGVVLHNTVFTCDIKRWTQLQTDREAITCFRCGENGHYKSECLNWKTKLCWHINTHTRVCSKTACPFAHGEYELRTPWHLRCVRIVKCAHGFVNLGCKSNTHTFRFCPDVRDGDNATNLGVQDGRTAVTATAPSAETGNRSENAAQIHSPDSPNVSSSSAHSVQRPLPRGAYS